MSSRPGRATEGDPDSNKQTRMDKDTKDTGMGWSKNALDSSLEFWWIKALSSASCQCQRTELQFQILIGFLFKSLIGQLFIL